MIYVEHRPQALAEWVRSIWYVCAPDSAPGRDRVLPSGDTQIVFNLAGETLTGCGEQGATWKIAPSLISGLRRTSEFLDTRDYAEMIGVVFRPGGLRRFITEPVGSFSFGDTSLEDVWGRSAVDLRERLRKARTPGDKFLVLESELTRRLRATQPHPAVRAALDAILRRPQSKTIAGLAAQSGMSARRLSELFRDEVGVAPKLFSRLLRFRIAVRRLHCGDSSRWPELALECGYYDQSHFVHDFRDFSGINPTIYTRNRGPWANHVRMD